MPAKQVGFEIPAFSPVEFLSFKEGEKRKLAFIEAIPGRDFPVTQLKRHYICEEQNGSKYIMCTGGRCCQYETWDSFSKSYAKSKPKVVYWVPCVHYFNDPNTLEVKAGVSILTLNYYQYSRYIEQINAVPPGGLSFFQRDIEVSFAKNGQYGDYAFIRGDNQALYLANPAMKAQVEEKLRTFAVEIDQALPPEYSEIELEAKIEEWNKVKAAKALANSAPNTQIPTGATQLGYSQLAGQATVQQMQTQQIPVQQMQTQQTQQIPVQQVQPQMITPQQVQPQVVTQQVPVQQVQPQVVTQQVQPQTTQEVLPQANPVGNEQFTLNDLAQVLQTPAE